MSLSNRLYFVLIIGVYFSVTFSVSLSSIGISFVHFALSIVLLGMFILTRGISSSFVYLIVPCSFLVALVQLFLGFDLSFKFIVSSFFAYLFPLVFWFSVRRKFYFSSKSLVGLASIIGIVLCVGGVIQFFYSKNIFGLLPNSSYYKIDFESEAFVDNGSFFRTRSFLPSSQILSLFLALLIIYRHRYADNMSRTYLFDVLYGIVLVITGQRLGPSLLLLYFAINAVRSNKLPLLAAISIIFFFAIAFISSSDTGLLPIRRIVALLDINETMAGEKEGRLNMWSLLLNSTNVLIGNGYGNSWLVLNGHRVTNTESHLLTLYFEQGLFITLFYIISLVQMFRREILLLFIILLSMMVVHSFQFYLFSIFLGITISANDDKKIMY